MVDWRCFQHSRVERLLPKHFSVRVPTTRARRCDLRSAITDTLRDQAGDAADGDALFSPRRCILFVVAE